MWSLAGEFMVVSWEMPIYPLVNIQKTMENHHCLIGKSTKFHGAMGFKLHGMNVTWEKDV